ncbi:MAG: YeeE/YedE family protein [Pseudomonadota bacterium]
MEDLVEYLGEGTLLVLAGGLIGLCFGAAAYASRFCLRAATVEVADGAAGARLSIWLVAFFGALLSVQLASAAGVLEVGSARQLAATGSLSGAIVGGLMFGAGMVLARGCASRLLVLSASGNLRAIVTGLVLTLTAQASLRGVLAPAREAIAGLWTVPGGATRSLGVTLGLGNGVVVLGAFICLAGALAFGLRHWVRLWELAAALVVGLCVYAGWQATYAISNASFEIVAVESLTFTGPSTDTLMAFINARALPAGFGMGLVIGVFLGAMAAAMIRGEARIQRFEPDTPMERYLVGGVLMGFGSMLAGGCAVGAGLSGGAILATTAWLAVFSMWVGAVLTHRAMSYRGGVRLA